MPPKAPPGKNEPAKKPPARDAQPNITSTRRVKGGTGKKAKEKQKGQRLKLKGWLETKADWAKFDAWAKINAQPRKIPEPEPVLRASKPLSQMKKRIIILSRPHKQPDISKTCRSDLRVSKKALTAKPSKRIRELAMFVVKNIQPYREFPVKISRAALRYKPTKRIIEISQPHLHLSEFCQFLAMQQVAGIPKETTERTKRLALAKKAIECPDLMSDQEMNILMTPTGIRRSALTYKFTPWMVLLSLPSYRFLKDQTDEKAEEWKRLILEESDTRGKKALELKRKKEEKKREEETKTLKEEKGDEKTDRDEHSAAAETEEAMESRKEDTAIEEKSDEGETGDVPQDSATNDEKKNEEPSRVGQKPEAGDSKKQEEKNAEDEEATKRRKEERNAWRFAPPPCINDPFEIKKSALKGKVSPRMKELAKHHVHEDRSCRRKPFEVRKSALNGPIPERITELAKPNHPRDPVERPAPREKDAFGRPIFPIPPYGKKMPRVKPFQEAECPDKAEKEDDEGESKKKEEKKSRAIDPIAYEPSIDPYLDPERAKRQLEARRAAKEEIERRKKTAEAPNNEPHQPQDPDKTN